MNLILELRREARSGDRSSKAAVRGGLRGREKVASKAPQKRNAVRKGLLSPRPRKILADRTASDYLGLLDVSLVEDVEDAVEPMLSEPFFSCSWLFFVVVVLLVSLPIWPLFDEFWAKIAQGNSDSPRAAIMIFFIFGISPYSY